MIKCAYNKIQLGHNLMKKGTQIKFSDWGKRWGRHTQKQDMSYSAMSPGLSACLQS